MGESVIGALSPTSYREVIMPDKWQRPTARDRMTEAIRGLELIKLSKFPPKGVNIRIRIAWRNGLTVKQISKHSGLTEERIREAL